MWNCSKFEMTARKFLKIKETVGIETPNTLHDSLVLENLVKWKGINVM